MFRSTFFIIHILKIAPIHWICGKLYVICTQILHYGLLHHIPALKSIICTLLLCDPIIYCFHKQLIIVNMIIFRQFKQLFSILSIATATTVCLNLGRYVFNKSLFRWFWTQFVFNTLSPLTSFCSIGFKLTKWNI